MASIERTAYRRFKRSPGPKELKSFFTPTLKEIQLAYSAASGSEPLLSFLVMLKCFQRLGYFPYPDEIPDSIPLHIAACLNVQGEVFPSYPAKT